ncbi:hypothetical protein [Streptomyces sp. B6B3]|uniref:hypothetical protein n=1 Tax=Streptomyces sp. B6B3 TaxID=3153570 RepID=UPI00325C9500
MSSAQVAANGQPGPRARHRARSPIIPPGPLPALLTAALAGLVAATAPFGRVGVLPCVVLLQAVTAAGWFRLNGMWPARQGIALAFAGGLAADAALLLAPEDSPVRVGQALLGALGVWFLLVLLLQLRHRGSADERLDSLTATAAASLLTVLAAGHLAAVSVSETAVLVTALGVAAAVLFRALPWPGMARALLALVAVAGVGVAAQETGAGALTGAWGVAALCVVAAVVFRVLPDPGVSTLLALLAAAGAGVAAQAVGADELTGAWGAGLGAAGGCCALIGLRVASYDFPSRFVHFTAGVALPLTAAAPAVYPLARLLA